MRANRRIVDNGRENQYVFEFDIDIRKSRTDRINEGLGKSRSEVEWIESNGSSMSLLEIDGAKLKKDPSYYVELSFHPHIIRTYGLVKSSFDYQILFLQETIPQGNLFELLHKHEFTPIDRVLWEIFQQICLGMIYLLKQGLSHGNLTCRNILVFQMNPLNPKKNLIKLTDFNLIQTSQLYQPIDTHVKTIFHTISIRYAAPELLENSKKPDYSEKSDVYSMGLLMWQASSLGTIPYSNVLHDEDIRQMKLNDQKLSQPTLCKDQLWAIINQCCQFKPKQRPNFSDLKSSLENLQIQENSNTGWDIDRSNSQMSNPSSFKDTDFKDCEEQPDDTQVFEHYDKFLKSSPSRQESNPTCPFCQDTFFSPDDLHEHLIQCGTKTDQCPNCQQFIQRAIFAYHYENDCALINSNRRSSSTTTNPSHFYSKQRTQSIISTYYDTPEILECQFCQNRCVKDDYEHHRNHCLRNPNNQLESSDLVVIAEDEIPLVKPSNLNKNTDDETNICCTCCCS